MISRIRDMLGPIDTQNRAAKNTFTTFADICGDPQKILPRSRIEVGTVLDLEAWGEFSTTGTPTLAMGFWINGAAGAAPTTILAQSTATTTGSGAAAWPWHLHWMGTIQAVGPGASGCTIEGQGILDLGTSLSAHSSMPLPITQALRTVTFDGTADRAVGVGAAWSASSVSNSLVVRKFYAGIF